MKPSLLHIIDSLAVGGAEKLLVGMINDLPSYEHHLMILHGPETLRAEIKVQYHFINLECGSIKSIFGASRKARKYIKENNISLVHSHLYEANLLARLATPKSIPLINSIHAISSLASYKVNRLSLYLEKLSYKRRHILIAVSKAVLDDFDKWVGVKGDRHVLYNFIEDRFFKTGERPYRDESKLKLVSVGNLRWQKNYPYLLRAFKNMPNDVSLDIYGQGSLKDDMQQEIDKNKLNVKLMGVKDHLENIIPEYDAFVMSSWYEGQPVSLLEATACGLPALLSDIPVLREVLEEDALYFDINDDGSLVRLVEEIKTGKHDLEAKARASRKKINEFAWKSQYIKKLEGIYQRYMH